MSVSAKTQKNRRSTAVESITEEAPHTLGFGVPATSDPHHFQVTIPRSNSSRVQISEHLGMRPQSLNEDVIDRVSLQRTRWTSIRSEVQRAFNARLKAYKLKTSTWRVGNNPVDRLLGKELCVLAWAIEDIEQEKIPVAVRNWLALRPEERWWLFGMTAISTGGLGDSNKGWRLALRHALGDVAQSELLAPETRRQQSSPTDSRPTLDLFGDGTK